MEAFKVLHVNDDIPSGFRLAQYEDIVNLELLRSALGSDKDLYICRLQDGQVAGPGYGYEIKQQQPDKRLEYKLLIRTLHSGEKILYVEEIDRLLPNQFQLAEVTDIVRLGMLKDALSDKRWHICKLTNGHVMGPGYGYLIKKRPYDGPICHKLVIGPRELAEVIRVKEVMAQSSSLSSVKLPKMYLRRRVEDSIPCSYLETELNATGNIDISSEFPDYHQSWSRRLFEVLDTIGVSISARDVQIRTKTTSEIMHSLSASFACRSLDNISCYIFGSSAEGTTTHGLDSDRALVKVAEDNPVVTNITEAQQYRRCFLLVQDSNTPPGYAKLQRVYNGVPVIRSSDSISIEDAEEKVIFISLAEQFGAQVIHGPAVSRKEQMNASDVDAYRCRTWPACASEWLTRRRYHNWPSQEQIDKCKTLGCFLMKAGHPRSDEKRLQWRISFALQERLLVTDFNAVQLKCYVLLKMINIEKIHNTIGEKLPSSYHFKTCMFYMIENTPAEFWREENLLVCLHQCLRQIIECVERGECSNYFMPGENMLDGRICVQMQNKLGDVLRRILAAEFKFLLDIRSDELGNNFQKALSQRVLDPKKLASMPRQRFNQYLYHIYQVVSCLLHNRNMMFTLNGYVDIGNICKFASCLYKKKYRLQTMSRVTEHSQTETREAISLLLPYVDITLMSVLVVAARRMSSSNELILSLLTSEKWHMISLESDMFSSKLKQASLLYMLGYYELSLEILLGLEDKIGQGIVSFCDCKGAETAKTVQGDVRESTSEVLLHQAILCVVYLPAERDLTPSPLCYEMDRSAGSQSDDKEAWYEWAVVDGKVLLYFLLYLNHRHLGMEAHAANDIDNIRWVMESDTNIRHKETAYNILGWIHLDNGRIDIAVDCFQKSIALQPTHNAGLWQLASILSAVINTVFLRL